MRSRWAAVPVLALVLGLASAACGGTGAGQARETASEAASEAGAGAASQAAVAAGRPVAEWLRLGGLRVPSLTALRPPSLVVYGGGLAVADAARQLRLPPAQVAALVEELERDLAGQPATASPRPGSPTVYDVPTTVLGVDSGGGMREVHVPYLDVAPDHYDPALAKARDRLSGLADRVTAQGTGYTADRVRLSAERLGRADAEAERPGRADADAKRADAGTNGAGAEAEPWPRGLPSPPEKETADYKGVKARAIARLVPADGRRHVYLTPSGEQIALSWRYLLPHE